MQCIETVARPYHYLAHVLVGAPKYDRQSRNKAISCRSSTVTRTPCMLDRSRVVALAETSWQIAIRLPDLCRRTRDMRQAYRAALRGQRLAQLVQVT